MENIGYLQVVRQTWQERYDMYMRLPKEELASMLAEQAKQLFPEQCKEFETIDDSMCEACSTYTYIGNDE